MDTIAIVFIKLFLSNCDDYDIFKKKTLKIS